MGFGLYTHKNKDFSNRTSDAGPDSSTQHGIIGCGPKHGIHKKKLLSKKPNKGHGVIGCFWFLPGIRRRCANS